MMTMQRAVKEGAGRVLSGFRLFLRGPWVTRGMLRDIFRAAEEGNEMELRCLLGKAKTRSVMVWAANILTLAAPAMVIACVMAEWVSPGFQNMAANLALVGYAAIYLLYRDWIFLRPYSSRLRAFDSTALMAAAQHGRVECIKVLLPFSNANATDLRGETALVQALKGRNMDAADVLLPHTDAKAHNDNRRDTALMIVAEQLDKKWVLKLLPLSRPLALNRFGQSAAELARAKGSAPGAEISELILAMSNKKRRAWKKSSSRAQPKIRSNTHQGPGLSRSEFLILLLPPGGSPNRTQKLVFSVCCEMVNAWSDRPVSQGGFMSEWIRFEDMDSLPREEILAQSNCCFWPRDREVGAGWFEPGAKLSIGRHEDDAEVCAHVLLNLGKYYFAKHLSPGLFKHLSAILAWLADGGGHLCDEEIGFDHDTDAGGVGVALRTFHDNLGFWVDYFDTVYDEFERRLDCGEEASSERWPLHWDVEMFAEFAPNTLAALRPHVKERLGRLFVKAQGECQVGASAFNEMDQWGDSGFFANFTSREEERALIHEYLLERDALLEAAQIADSLVCGGIVDSGSPRYSKSL